MANLTKAEREKREAEKENQIRAEIEAKLRKEFEEKLKAEIESKMTENKSDEKVASNTLETSKRIQSVVRIPLDTIVPVVCNIIGGATYISKKINGYRIEWDEIGSVEYMELGELVSMRNTDRRFFEDNWIVLEDTVEYSTLQLYDFLKVTKYYENILTPTELDDLLNLPKSEVVKICSSLSKGTKVNVAVRAKQKLDNNELDLNLLEPLEEILGIQLKL